MGSQCPHGSPMDTYILRIYYWAMQLPWASHAFIVLARVLWEHGTAMGDLRDSRGYPKSIPWFISHCSRMGLPWDFHGIIALPRDF